MQITWNNASIVEKRLLRGIRTLIGDNDHLLLLLLNSKTPQLRARPGIIRDDCWQLSHGELLQIQAALDIWSGSGHLPLWDCLETWDNIIWVRFIAAICILKNINPRDTEILIDKNEENVL